MFFSLYLFKYDCCENQLEIFSNCDILFKTSSENCDETSITSLLNFFYFFYYCFLTVKKQFTRTIPVLRFILFTTLNRNLLKHIRFFNLC